MNTYENFIHYKIQVHIKDTIDGAINYLLSHLNFMLYKSFHMYSYDPCTGRPAETCWIFNQQRTFLIVSFWYFVTILYFRTRSQCVIKLFKSNLLFLLDQKVSRHDSLHQYFSQFIQHESNRIITYISTQILNTVRRKNHNKISVTYFIAPSNAHEAAAQKSRRYLENYLIRRIIWAIPILLHHCGQRL